MNMFFRALDEDEYNYITATYYLLSERLLRSKNHTNFNRNNSQNIINNKNLKQSLKQNNSHVPSNDLNDGKRKKINGLSIQIESIIDEDQEIPHSPKNFTNGCTQSPCKLKYKNGLNEQLKELEFDFDSNQNDSNQLQLVNNNNNNTRRLTQRDLQLQTSIIPEEECEEIEIISLDNNTK
jgi:hypothetical protein